LKLKKEGKKAQKKKFLTLFHDTLQVFKNGTIASNFSLKKLQLAGDHSTYRKQEISRYYINVDGLDPVPEGCKGGNWEVVTRGPVSAHQKDSTGYKTATEDVL